MELIEYHNICFNLHLSFPGCWPVPSYTWTGTVSRRVPGVRGVRGKHSLVTGHHFNLIGRISITARVMAIHHADRGFDWCPYSGFTLVGLLLRGLGSLYYF